MFVMFTALTGVEDQGYYPADPRVVDVVLEHGADDVLQQLSAWFAEDYKQSLFDELRSQQNIRHALLSRVAQAYLFIAITHVLNKTYGARISAYGGYCGGIMSALYGSGALSLKVYREKLRRPLERLLQVMARSILTHDFVSAIFDFSDIGWDVSDVVAHLAGRDEEIFVKDVRSAGVVELVAGRAVLQRFVAELHATHGSCVRTSRFLQDTFAHTPKIQPEKFRDLFSELFLTAPAAKIFSSCGRMWHPGDAAEGLKTLYLDTMLEPIHMARCAKLLRAAPDELFVVGNGPVARYVFSGMGELKPNYRIVDAEMLRG